MNIQNNFDKYSQEILFYYLKKNKAIISLTQSETLSMKETYNVLMQARLKVNGEAYATDIVSVGVAAILKDGTIPGGIVDPDNPDNPGCDCGTIDYNDLKNKPTKLSDFINIQKNLADYSQEILFYYLKKNEAIISTRDISEGLFEHHSL